MFRAALTADPRSSPWVDPYVLTRQRVPTLAVRLALGRQILGVGDQLQMVGIPAGMDATPMMQFPAFWNWAAEELPAKSVGVTVLRLGDPPVRSGRAREQPARPKLRVGRS